MSVNLILGAQWGDEGKGKIIDALSSKSDFVVRFHGGNNAGHTVINPLGEFKLHLIPVGIFQPKTIAIISNGVVLDLEVLAQEIYDLKKAGINLDGRLIISPRCHIILPYHKVLEKIYENAKNDTKTGTTGRGIGPVYADKVSYNGIRLFDFLDKKLLSKKLQKQLEIKNKIFDAFDEKELKLEEIEKKLEIVRKLLTPFVKEPFPILQDAISKNKKILVEGAQAIFLDNDWGTYPYVTASNAVSGNVTAGAGITPNKITKTIGVIKAYTTRVGEGPFPTELQGKEGEVLRELGHEYGATTGRARRCGWLDLEMIKFAANLCGINEFAITKIDILDTYDVIKICTGYTLNGKKTHYYECDSEDLFKVKPVYTILKGWKSSTFGLTDFSKFPSNAKKFVDFIEKTTEIKIKYISTGPKRNQMLSR